MCSSADDGEDDDDAVWHVAQLLRQKAMMTASAEMERPSPEVTTDRFVYFSC